MTTPRTPSVGGAETLRDRLRKALEDNAVTGTENQGLHGWRCQYPESYGNGPCHCVDDLLNDLEAAALAAEAMVAQLNANQQVPNRHPYTCANRGDGRHVRTTDLGVLVATAHGWTCPSCDYQQAFR